MMILFRAQNSDGSVCERVRLRNEKGDQIINERICQKGLQE